MPTPPRQTFTASFQQKTLPLKTSLRPVGALSAVPSSQAAIDASNVINSAQVKQRMEAFQAYAKSGEKLTGPANSAVAQQLQIIVGRTNGKSTDGKSTESSSDSDSHRLD